ncbi:hypothetical protein A3Q35_07405 [Aeribacillus pallidus]|uniref:hypothetical protein n=1 Tax=Aeribacillus pallidus TaxID=33936 RepID=UPI0007B478DA|nr:hypothetical protein [Aeribacillus pallidus]KZM56860.1 hypothetical protein A3Q35_07405 [Aeribacillus pallidus]
MIQWIKDNKFSSYVLFFIAFTLSFISIILSIYISMGSEAENIPIMLKKEGAPAYAVFGIVLVFIILSVIMQLFVGASITHFFVKFLFRIPLQFSLFYRVYLIFTSFLALSIIWQLFMFRDTSNIFFILANPFLLSGLFALFILLKRMANLSWKKPLLFTIFSLFVYLAFTFLGGCVFDEEYIM